MRRWLPESSKSWLWWLWWGTFPQKLNWRAAVEDTHIHTCTHACTSINVHVYGAEGQCREKREGGGLEDNTSLLLPNIALKLNWFKIVHALIHLCWYRLILEEKNKSLTSKRVSSYAECIDSEIQTVAPRVRYTKKSVTVVQRSQSLVCCKDSPETLIPPGTGLPSWIVLGSGLVYLLHQSNNTPKQKEERKCFSDHE